MSGHMSKSTALIIVFGIGLIVIFLVLTISYYRKWENQYGDFDSIGVKDYINSKFVILRLYKGYSYIKVGDNRQFVLKELRNYNYSPHSLDELITSCDSIVKHVNSDTMYIYSTHTKQKYKFVLDRNIEKIKKQ